MALIDADHLDYYHQLERERVHLLLSEARRGLGEVVVRGAWNCPFHTPAERIIRLRRCSPWVSGCRAAR